MLATDLLYHFPDGKPIMYEKSFMQDIAYQNFAKYDVKYRLKTPVVVSGVHACLHALFHTCSVQGMHLTKTKTLALNELVIYVEMSSLFHDIKSSIWSEIVMLSIFQAYY